MPNFNGGDISCYVPFSAINLFAFAITSANAKYSSHGDATGTDEGLDVLQL